MDVSVKTVTFQEDKIKQRKKNKRKWNKVVNLFIYVWWKILKGQKKKIFIVKLLMYAWKS